MVRAVGRRLAGRGGAVLGSLLWKPRAGRWEGVKQVLPGRARGAGQRSSAARRAAGRVGSRVAEEAGVAQADAGAAREASARASGGGGVPADPRSLDGTSQAEGTAGDDRDRAGGPAPVATMSWFCLLWKVLRLSF